MEFTNTLPVAYNNTLTHQDEPRNPMFGAVKGTRYFYINSYLKCFIILFIPLFILLLYLFIYLFLFREI